MKKATLKAPFATILLNSLTTLFFVFTTGAYGATEVTGTLYPEQGELTSSSSLLDNERLLNEDHRPVQTKARAAEASDYRGGFNALLPFIVPSPDQENAGSCLFMSHTGATEILLNQYFGKVGGEKLDLSERYLMNLAKADIGDDLIRDWKTDTIYRLNKTGQTYLNRDFPYMKGWYRYSGNQRVFAEPEENGAYYGVKANWVISLNELAGVSPLKTPRFERDVLFADPSGNRWNVGTAPTDIVERVKLALTNNSAPVIVIYNHTGIWHAVTVTGFNDNTPTGNCPFVKNFPVAMNDRAREIREEARQATDSSEEGRLLRKAKLFEKRATQVEDSLADAGGCRDKGVFYVRDSVYPVEGNTLYDYDPSREGEETPLNNPVILREYEWLEHLGNHAYQIRLQGHSF